MATKKAKSSKTSKSATKPKNTAKVAEESVSEVAEVEEVVEVISSEKDEATFKGFFGKKYEENESILTIFKSPKFYGALVGEVLGTLLITMLLLSFQLVGMSSIATAAIVLIAIYVAVYAFSGASLNPIITAGMMASRRMSVIRGVMYIIAEIVGAWVAWLIFNGFYLAAGDTAGYEVPTLTAVGEDQFWIFAMIELLGAVVIAFFYARALKYKKSAFTFGAVVAGGVAVATMIGFVVSVAFFSLQNNFVFNPASALMMGIFPTTGESFGEVFGGIMQALSIYAIIPMLGGIAGFCISDITARLSGSRD